MVDNMDIYKSLNITNCKVMKNAEMIKFVPDHLKTKNVGKHVVTKITLSIKICS